MATASIYDPKTEDDGWQDRNTANIVFDLALGTCESGSFSLLKSRDLTIRVGVRRNGHYICTFDDLHIGVVVSQGATVVYEDHLNKIIANDCPFLMNCCLPTLDNDVEYAIQVWAKEGDTNIVHRTSINIPDYEDVTTQMENPPGTVVYHDGYYPDDEQWERDKPYHPEGYVRPVPPT